MICHPASDALVGRGNQNQFPARLVAALKIFEELLVVRQRRRVKRNPSSHLPLEAGPATQQPEGKQEKKERIGSHQRQQRLMQGIGPDERSVQVDAQRRFELLVDCYRLHRCIKGPNTAAARLIFTS